VCFSKQGANFFEFVTHLCVFSGCIGLPCRYVRLVCRYVGFFFQTCMAFWMFVKDTLSKPAANSSSMLFDRSLLRKTDIAFVCMGCLDLSNNPCLRMISVILLIYIIQKDIDILYMYIYIDLSNNPCWRMICVSQNHLQI